MVSAETLANVELIAKWFGCDLEWNRHIFRAGADADADGFAAVMRAMAQEIQRDVRFGINQRIRDDIQKRRGVSR